MMKEARGRFSCFFFLFVLLNLSVGFEGLPI